MCVCVYLSVCVLRYHIAPGLWSGRFSQCYDFHEMIALDLGEREQAREREIRREF